MGAPIAMSQAMTSPAIRCARVTALDGLRFFAVAGVMAVHFSPGSLGKLGPWGDWGVRVFFVLSGYLITGILIGMRDRIDAGHAQPTTEYGRFFSRRAFRLFPAYAATLVAATALGLHHAEETLPWNLGFATNYFITLHQIWPQLLSHLWTLAVEFQFYLLWPWVMLAAPRLAWRKITIWLLLAGPAFRFIELALVPDSVAIGILLPSAVDYFGFGGLLALTPPAAWPKHPGRIAAVALATSLLAVHLGFASIWPAWRALDPTLIATGSVALVAYLVQPGPGLFRDVCRLPVLRYLGRISYGIYLYHNLAHRLSPSLIRRLTGENYLPNEAAHVAVLVAISILLAMTSWHVLELPLERLREHLTKPRAPTQP